MKTSRRAALLLAGASLLGAAAPPDGDRLDTADFLEPHFNETFPAMPAFRRGKIRPAPARPLLDPGFVWTAGYIHAQPAAVGAFSSLHDELEVYPNGDAIAALPFSPFSLEPGGLAITARPMPAPVRPMIPAGLPTDYLSGAISSYPFAQRYGYFEMRARIPAGRGLWPAFWLLPADMSWPPEIDVMEVLGHAPETLYTTLHSRLLPGTRSRGLATHTEDLSRAVHAYGVDWGPEQVRFYLDRRQVFSQPTPADWHQPFYLLANLAVGGPHSWPGAPDARTVFPASLRIESIRAWQRRRYQLGKNP